MTHFNILNDHDVEDDEIWFVDWYRKKEMNKNQTKWYSIEQ